MYYILAYNLSSIQKGVQATHAIARYARDYGSNQDYMEWINNHETAIFLDGGTSNSTYNSKTGEYKGSLNNILALIKMKQIFVSAFYEEDANNMLTCIAVLADERVWDTKKYPDPLLETESEYKNYIERVGGEQNSFLRQLLLPLKLAV